MKRLARLANNDNLLDSLSRLDTAQSVFQALQTVTMEDFLGWRDKTLGTTASLYLNADLEVRKAWLWIFSMQVVYGLRISETIAIQNLEKPYITKDGVSIPALSDPNNTGNLIYISFIPSSLLLLVYNLQDIYQVNDAIAW